MQQGSGLTASELSGVLAELGPLIEGATVRDVARLRDRDDLLFFLEGAAAPRYPLHVVTGGRRARVTCTARRFSKAEYASGPLIDRLADALRGATLGQVTQPPGERRCTFALVDRHGAALSLQAELFGARGLWCLVDANHTIRELSRLPNTAGRSVEPGAVYAPPTARADPPAEPEPRFAAPHLPAVDRFFTARDLAEETATLQRQLTQALERAKRKQTHKAEGMAQQLAEVDRVAELRLQADMLLAYGFGMPPKSTSMTVPDPRDPDRSLTFELRPDLPIQVQAERLYQRARKLEDGAAIAAQRRAEALAELTHLAELRLAVDAATDQPALDALRDRLIEHGILRATTQELKARRSPTGRERQLQKMTKGHNFRCYDSAEGHPIMVGRSNQQNDRLSVSVARGNDLWFHVGRGYAGSHVVMRLEKGKLASLESLLDAATLAIHFSKARNAARCEVIYTLAKNVRKPKGLPPGRVTTTNTKTLQVDVEPDRLRRLLDSGDHGED